MISPANVGERHVAGHLLSVEAKWQAQQSSFFARARPILVVGGLLWQLGRGPLRQRQRNALVCAAAKKEAESEDGTALKSHYL
jgi:hypothetical protein